MTSRSLNPYSNGICSKPRTTRLNLITLAMVLILILMEYALSRVIMETFEKKHSVLILILMEYALSLVLVEKESVAWGKS